jgi:hypothetical protein
MWVGPGFRNRAVWLIPNEQSPRVSTDKYIRDLTHAW